MESKLRVFFSPTCGHCRRAKEFLSKRGLDFEAFDVTSDNDAYEEMKRITNGARSVPVLEIGGQILIGFDQDKVEEALESIGA